jgi:hypothetical protein
MAELFGFKPIAQRAADLGGGQKRREVVNGSKRKGDGRRAMERLAVAAQ